MYIRPYYLGNYDQSAEKRPKEISYSFSGWSQWKDSQMPRSAIAYIGLILAYYIALGVFWWRNSSRRLRLVAETLAVVAMAGIFACIVPLIGDGEADLGKHLFMFNVCFDMMIVSALTGAVYGLVRLVERRKQA